MAMTNAAAELLQALRDEREGCVTWDGGRSGDDQGSWVSAAELDAWIKLAEALQPTDWQRVAREHRAVMAGEADFELSPDGELEFVPRTTCSHDTAGQPSTRPTA